MLARPTDLLSKLYEVLRLTGDVFGRNGGSCSAVVALAVTLLRGELFAKVCQHLGSTAVGVIDAELNDTTGVIHSVFNGGFVITRLPSSLVQPRNVLVCIV